MKTLLVLAAFLCAYLHSLLAYCEGDWEQLPYIDDNYHIQAARSAHDNNAINRTNQLWLDQACPAQMAVYTCYFHGNASRAEELERRRFVPKPNPSDRCQAFHPMQLMEKLRDKHVVFMGDSILIQLWVSLVCTIHPLLDTQLAVHFAKLGTCNNITCPDPHSNRHGSLHRGWIYVPSYNLSLSLVQEPRYSLKAVEHIYSKHHLSSSDLVVFNYGVHFNNRSEFDAVVRTFKAEIIEGKYGYGGPDSGTGVPAWKQHLPPILYFQAAPQHFPGGNGYYSPQDSSPYAGQCQAADPARRRAEDWRNSVLDEHLLSIGDGIDSPLHMVRIAEALYSQHDAHVGTEPYVRLPLDCTHWCFPSGIFKYMHLMLYNALHRLVDHRKEVPVFYYGLDLREGMLVKSKLSKDVFLLKQGQRRPFSSLSAFTSRGFDFAQVVTVDAWDLQLIPEGEPLT